MLPLLLLVACGVEEDPAEHACEHITEAGVAVVAGASADEASAIELSEEPYTVALDAAASTFVKVTVAENTAALLFVDTADVVVGIAHDGDAETLPAPAPNEDCAETIPEHFDLDLHAATWVIELAPSAVESVWLMLMSAEGHGHDE